METTARPAPNRHPATRSRAPWLAAGLIFLILLAPPLRASGDEVPPRAVNDALSLLAEGRADDASAALEDLLVRARQTRNEHARGVLLWGLASSRIEQGRFSEAAELSAASRAAWEELGDSSWQREAARLCAEAERLRDRGGASDPSLRIAFLRQLALLELKQLRPGRALRHLDAALEEIDPQARPAEHTGLTLTRGLTLLLLQQPEAAARDLERSGEAAGRVHPALTPHIDRLTGLLLGYASGDLDLVVERLEEVGEVYGHHLPPVFFDFMQLTSLLRADRWDEAGPVCDRIVERSAEDDTTPLASYQATLTSMCAAVRLFAAPSEDGPPMLEILSLLGHLGGAIEEQHPAAREALSSFLGTLSSAADGAGDSHPSPSPESVTATLDGFHRLLGEVAPLGLRAAPDSALAPVFETLIETQVRAGNASAAFEHAEKVRARELLDRLGGVEAHVADDGAKDRIATLQRRRDALEHRLADAAWGAGARTDLEHAHAELSQVREALDRALRTVALERRTAERVEPLTLEEIRAGLDDRTTLVAFLTFPGGGEDTVAWVLGRGQLHQVRLPFSATELAGRVAHFRRVLEDGAALGRLPADLYRDIWSPLEALISTRRVLLVPHGPLHELPFAALRHPENGRWLAQDRTLIQAPSASAYVRMTARGARSSGAPLVLGDPTGDLTAARAEARAVAALWSVPPLLGPQASEEELRRRLPGPRMIHLASHGVVGHDQPLLSWLALAPSGGGPDSPRQDGRLELHEVIEDLDLDGTELVVLSACSTGSGPRTRGDEVANFARAALAAGARSVVTAAWPVEDGSAARLMTDFHRRLAAGDDAAEALRRAREAAIASPERSHPVHWAAFTLRGAPPADGRSGS